MERIASNPETDGMFDFIFGKDKNGKKHDENDVMDHASKMLDKLPNGAHGMFNKAMQHGGKGFSKAAQNGGKGFNQFKKMFKH